MNSCRPVMDKKIARSYRFIKYMANQMFLKLEGVRGESRNPRHVGEIDILGWSWSGKQRQQMLALGAPQGELSSDSISDLTITKSRDSTSQVLFEACFSGKQFGEALVTTEHISATGSLNQTLIFKLKIVTVSSTGTKDNSGAEFVTLNFEKAEVGYRL